MISREEAEDFAVDLIKKDEQINSIPIALYTVRLIDAIYESLGSCGECEHFDTSAGNSPEHGYCMYDTDTLQALWVNVEVDSNESCTSNFKRKKEEK